MKARRHRLPWWIDNLLPHCWGCGRSVLWPEREPMFWMPVEWQASPTRPLIHRRCWESVLSGWREGRRSPTWAS